MLLQEATDLLFSFLFPTLLVDTHMHTLMHRDRFSLTIDDNHMSVLKIVQVGRQAGGQVGKKVGRQQANIFCVGLPHTNRHTHKHRPPSTLRPSVHVLGLGAMEVAAGHVRDQCVQLLLGMLVLVHLPLQKHSHAERHILLGNNG